MKILLKNENINIIKNTYMFLVIIEIKSLIAVI